MMGIEVKNLSFSYKNHPVLQDISFDVRDGEFVSVLGPNGVGKSTLFKCILRLLTPEKGEILVNGNSIRNMTAEELASVIAYIPQTHSPVFNFTVEEIVLMGTTSQVAKLGVPGKKQQERAEQAMHRLGIEKLADRDFATLSGGEQQLALIARAMAQQARLLVMDEPSSSLDFGNKIRMMKTVKSLTKLGYTIIQSTHDPEQAYFYSNRILALKDGRVLAYGRPEEVVCEETVSALYGVEIAVSEVQRGVVACTPKDLHRMNQEMLESISEMR